VRSCTCLADYIIALFPAATLFWAATHAVLGGSELFKATVKSTVFWPVTLCSSDTDVSGAR
jgi:hypothetical protein